MPVTRSSSNKPLSRYSVLAPSPGRMPGSSNATGQADVIILSDGDEYPAEKPNKASASKSKKKNNRQRGKARAKLLVPSGEIVDISSEDERPVVSLGVIADLQRQVQMLQKENAGLKTARKLEADKKTITLDISKIEDNISCEICTSTLWQPFILPECGHTFCQSCLVDWFNTTLAQHMTAYPNYNHNIHNQPFNTLVTDCIAHRNMNPHIQFHLQALLPHLQLEVPAPQFTCPTCRKQVKTRPVEDFALKSIVRAIAGAAGESSPKKQGGRQRSGAGRPQDTWEGFFRTPV